MKECKDKTEHVAVSMSIRGEMYAVRYVIDPDIPIKGMRDAIISAFSNKLNEILIDEGEKC